MWKSLWYFMGALVAVGAQEEVPNGQPKEQGRIISGIHAESLPPPIFYESYIPIVLEYKTPKWNKTDIVFNNWYTCWSDTAPFRYSCPVAFHMNRAVVNLHVDFGGLHPIQDEDEQEEVQRVAKAHYSRLTESSEFCSTIQRHFQGIWTHSEDFEGYLEALENCHWDSPVVLGEKGASENLHAPLIERSIGQFNYSIRLPFTRMENNFYNTFYKHIVSRAAGGGGSLLVNGSTVITNTSTGIPNWLTGLTNSTTGLTNSSTGLPNSSVGLTNSSTGLTNSSTGLTNSSTIPIWPSPVPQRPNLDLVASALLSNARTTLQAAILGLFYAEKNRWVHANQDCARQVIPQSLVTPDKFNSTLSKLEEQVQRAMEAYYYEVNFKNKEDLKNYKLAIPRGSFSQYFSLPLTDCTHTNDDSLVVRIQIPVIKKHRATTLSLTRVHNIPFQYKDHLCRLRISSSDNIRGSSHGGAFEDVYNGGGSSGPSSGFSHSSHLYIFNELSGLAYSTDCKESQLCRISEYGLNPKNADPCVSALLAKNRPGVLKSCHLHCSRVEEASGGSPIVTRIRSNAYILTGNYLKFKVKCKGGIQASHFVEEEAERTGALWVGLPCRCKLIVDGKFVFYGEGRSGSGCGEKVEIYPVMPLHFGRVKPKGGSEKGDFYVEKVGDSVFVNLADYFDEEKVEGFLRNAAERKQKAVEAAKLGGSGGSGGNGDSTSVTVLWVVFVIVASILGGLQAYVLYLLKRQERVGYVKDERILYKVPDSPVLY